MRWTPILALALGLGCATSPPGAATPAAPDPAPTPEPAPVPEPAPNADPAPAIESPRSLPAKAGFGTLTALVGSLTAGGQGESPRRCLLGHEGDGFQLEADLAPALQSVPDAPKSLAKALAEHPSRARVLTGHGMLGDPTGSGLTVASLSSGPATDPAEGAFVIALTADGASLRHTRVPLPGLDGVDDDALASHLLSHHRGGDVYLTAEADVPVSRVHDVLSALPEGHRAVLAIALPANTRLPAPANDPAAPPGCADGLPEPEPGAAEGGLPAAALQRGLTPLAAAGAPCLEHAGPRGQRGGRLVVAIRIAADGRPAHVCTVEDPIGDVRLAACLLEVARGLRFPAPSPTGSVDVHLPLSLSAVGPAVQRPTCER